VKIFLLAGERSGDAHGAALARSFRSLSNDVKLSGWGGDEMRNADVEVLYPIEKLNFIGFAEIVKKLPTIFRQFSLCKKQITTLKPDAVILIDYPGFNIRMSKWLKKQNIPCYFYISPQVWAWKKNRIYTLQKTCKKIFCILPFEETFYKKHGVENVQYVGHPLITKYISRAQNESEHKAVAVFPGSRVSELQRMIPVFQAVIKSLPDLQFKIAAISSLRSDHYEVFDDQKNVEIIYDQPDDVRQQCGIALITSGTATLETALMGIPQVVAYKVHPLTYAIGKRLANVSYFSLVNLILGRELIIERLQTDCTPEILRSDILDLVQSAERRQEILAGYTALRGVLGPNDPSETVAKCILQDL